MRETNGTQQFDVEVFVVTPDNDPAAATSADFQRRMGELLQGNYLSNNPTRPERSGESERVLGRRELIGCKRKSSGAVSLSWDSPPTCSCHFGGRWPQPFRSAL